MSDECDVSWKDYSDLRECVLVVAQATNVLLDNVRSLAKNHPLTSADFKVLDKLQQDLQWYSVRYLNLDLQDNQ